MNTQNVLKTNIQKEKHMSGISDKQLAANRQNAKSSSGPKSAIGKEVSSRNPLKHGILQQIIINSSTDQEERSRYQSIWSNLIDEWAPKGEMETFLIEKIVTDSIRLKRVLYYEFCKVQKDIEKYLPLINDDIFDNIKRSKSLVEVLKNFDQNPIAAVNCVVDLSNTGKSGLDFLGPKLIDKLSSFENITSKEEEMLQNGISKLANHISKNIEKQREYHEKMSRLAFIDSFLNEKEIAKITKYENAIERSIFRNLEKLIALQKMRGKIFK